jgi:hypothetical protein
MQLNFAQACDEPPPTTVVRTYLTIATSFRGRPNSDDYELQVLPPTVELLDYFRQRVSEFEKLEEDYVARIEALTDSAPGTSF